MRLASPSEGLARRQQPAVEVAGLPGLRWLGREEGQKRAESASTYPLPSERGVAPVRAFPPPTGFVFHHREGSELLRGIVVELRPCQSINLEFFENGNPPATGAEARCLESLSRWKEAGFAKWPPEVLSQSRKGRDLGLWAITVPMIRKAPARGGGGGGGLLSGLRGGSGF